MIGFFQTGGIGDAILGTSIARNLHKLYGEISVLYCDRLVPQVYQGMEFISSMIKIDMKKCQSQSDLSNLMKDYEFVVFNKFRKGIDGNLNFFVPVSKESFGLCEEYRKKYTESLSNDIGMKISDVSDVPKLRLISFFNSETNYFSDWNRYGVKCGYDDVKVDLYDYTKKYFSESKIPSKFIIIHDSRFPVNGKSQYLMKSWNVDKWKKLCERISCDFNMPIVQILSPGQSTFCDGIIPHYELIGKDAIFQDYLYLLSKSSVYIGTDSWPSHAAIFTRDPKYILLKGSVSRRWDHGGKYSSILRIGECQACEGALIDTSKCAWYDGHRCMDNITVDIVYEELLRSLGEKNNCK